MTPPSGPRVTTERVEALAYSLFEKYYPDDVQNLAADLLDARAEIERLRATPPAAKPDEAEEVGGESLWLIERGQSENQAPTVWWCGPGDHDFTEDANKAIRFRKWGDAAEKLEQVGYGKKYVFGRVTEHVFLTKPDEVCGTCGGTRTVMCDKCCWGDRCDEPSHHRRGQANFPCPACKNTYKLPCPSCATPPQETKCEHGYWDRNVCHQCVSLRHPPTPPPTEERVVVAEGVYCDYDGEVIDIDRKGSAVLRVADGVLSSLDGHRVRVVVERMDESPLGKNFGANAIHKSGCRCDSCTGLL